MADLFNDLITQEFKDLHSRMMDGLLDTDELTVECRLIYSSTRFEDCENCIFSPIGGQSSNTYQAGGPIPFYHGVCPLCNGEGKRPKISTENIFMMPIWNSKDWFPMNQTQINMADISVQTLSKFSTRPKIMRATNVVIDTSIENHGMPDFIRLGEPEICGLGQSTHILTSWKRK